MKPPRDVAFFLHPTAEWQRRYEALRASFVERLSAEAIAQRFGYKAGYVRLLRHYFRHGKIDFSEPVAEGKAARRRVTAEVRRKISEWRRQRLSGGDIVELLGADGVEISIRTVERVLAEEGFEKLPRRTRLKIGLTVEGARVPDRSEAIAAKELDGARFDSPTAGLFLFAPFLEQLDFASVVGAAGLPATKAISATSYLLSALALKLLGTERYAHVGNHAFDRGLGLFAGLNVVPKCTALSTYSYSLDEAHLQRLQEAFVKQAYRIGLYRGTVINLDFHTTPHHGDESVLEQHWITTRNKKMKSALTLFGQDAETKLLLYSACDIRRREADDQVLGFLDFWKKVHRGAPSTFVFDSRLTTLSRLQELNRAGVKFITLRRRGKSLLASAAQKPEWRRIHIPHGKRKYPDPEVCESVVEPQGYGGKLRQVVVRGNGHEKPAFVLTNDFDAPVDLLVGNYARRWRVENSIAEAVKFFNLNALSSPIVVKIHFDVVLTMIADTLYSMLANRLPGFEDCDAAKLHRHFVDGHGMVSVDGGAVTVTYPKRAHNPILRKVPWDNLPMRLPSLAGAPLTLRFK